MVKTRLTRMVSSVAVATVTVVSPMVAAVPAGASSKHIGHSGQEYRCNVANNLGLCLYYDHRMTTGAFWGTAKNDSNLYNNTFISGTGTGAGQVVKNNATAMACDDQLIQCFSYYNSGYLGNYDWEYGGEMGELSYTWNDNASVEVILKVYS